MKLAEQLKKDKELYRAYKDNIAMSFKDEYNNYFKYIKKYSRYCNYQDLHQISNKAADNFLKLLIK